jgi:hypothetical protein
MDISEEAGRVSLNLLDLEASASVNPTGIHSGNEGTCQTSDAVSNLVVTNRVWEGDTWWTSLALYSLVNVCCSSSW